MEEKLNIDTGKLEMQLLKIALLLKDPNASYQDLLDIINPPSLENSNLKRRDHED